MTNTDTIESFLDSYSDQVVRLSSALRDIIMQKLPEIQERVDAPAKMIAYSYGPRYADLICTIIPSQKGVKLGFNRCVKLSDPHSILQGSGKISRYIDMKTVDDIQQDAISKLLKTALDLYTVDS